MIDGKKDGFSMLRSSEREGTIMDKLQKESIQQEDNDNVNNKQFIMQTCLSM